MVPFSKDTHVSVGRFCDPGRLTPFSEVLILTEHLWDHNRNLPGFKDLLLVLGQIPLRARLESKPPPQTKATDPGC